MNEDDTAKIPDEIYGPNYKKPEPKIRQEKQHIPTESELIADAALALGKLAVFKLLTRRMRRRRWR